MKATRKFFGLGIMVYLVLASVALLGMLGSALAGGSQSLVLENAEGESLTVGSVSAETNGTNIIINIVTEAGYPIADKNTGTFLTFRGNPGGIQRAMSVGRPADTQYLTYKSSHRHTYAIPLSEIKNDGVAIWVSADVIVDGRITGTRKAYITIVFEIPPTTTTTAPTTTISTIPTTTSTIPTTTSTTKTTQPPGTTTTTRGVGNGAVTTTTAGVGNGVITTTTTAPGVTATTVAGVTTTTIKPVETTVLTKVARAKVTREALPFTGTQSNSYLGGLLLMLTGAGLFLGSLKRSNG